MHFFENNSNTIYPVSAGGTLSKENGAYSLNGICIETSLGFLFETHRGFYFLPSIKIGGIFQNKESSRGIGGVDLIIG